MMKRLLTVFAISLLPCVSSGCKPRKSSVYGAKSDGIGNGCVAEISSRVDTMGIRVEDAAYGAGARIACVEANLGLHVQYGLLTGDVIVALNRNTPIKSAADFEEKVKTLEANFDEPISAWEFTVDRAGQKLTLAAKPEWGGCIPESFNRCGSVTK